MSEPRNNPAGRLHAVLSRVTGVIGSEVGATAWAQLLGVTDFEGQEARQDREVARLLGVLQDQVHLLQRELAGQPAAAVFRRHARSSKLRSVCASCPVSGTV